MVSIGGQIPPSTMEALVQRRSSGEKTAAKPRGSKQRASFRIVLHGIRYSDSIDVHSGLDTRVTHEFLVDGHRCARVVKPRPIFVAEGVPANEKREPCFFPRRFQKAQGSQSRIRRLTSDRRSIVGRGPRAWLVRVYNGRDPETTQRKYLNQTIHGGLRKPPEAAADE
jgi:hypothetical protein